MSLQFVNRKKLGSTKIHNKMAILKRRSRIVKNLNKSFSSKLMRLNEKILIVCIYKTKKENSLPRDFRWIEKKNIVYICQQILKIKMKNPTSNLLHERFNIEEI